ncbi:hypothetical protein JHN52_39715 [Streptomyces sp. MBT97]|uniref:hypothetical protein n=1 Tax=Streptomyces sp. MBT97 TaxID=2800411 RepID=UPI00190AC0AD|nr:hypothetical protein [Streptomyces sp. MBT97]MBK3638859.1 hypothetical protein [Streptomyces sp. MBT97]
MKAPPGGSQAGGDGCAGPDEHLIRAGYSLGGGVGCIADAVSQDLFIEQEPVGKRITARIPLS